jgi:hypothetical protein
MEAANFRSGSIATELSYPDDVRFTPDSDQTADIPVRQLRANKRPQSMTSALTRRDGGIVTPSALAVFMLMAKSKRVGP